MLRGVVAVVSGLGMLAATAGQAVAAPADQPRQVVAPVPELDWRGCGEGLAGFQCAVAEVPTDYDRPHGATTSIALTRLPATDRENRIGTLFTNPGGPGGSGVDFVQQNAKRAYSAKARERFDILGFDPRAVGASDPATCFASQQEENEALAGMPAFPVGAREERAYVDDNRRLATSCARTSGERFAHSSTANVARDMDLLRQAVGDDELSYVGYSYGTYLGATYARLFPGRVRALVLDGTVDPRAYSGSDGDPRSVGARLGQGGGGAATYGEFLRLCRAAGPSGCALAGLGDPRQVMERTFARLRTDPVTIEGPDGPLRVTYATAVQLVFFGMYDPAGWPELAATLANLATGSGDQAATRQTVERLTAAAPHRRGADYPSVGGALASLCVDTGHPMPAPLYPALADVEDTSAPHFGRFRAWVGVQCAGLGIEDEDAYHGPWQQQVDEPVLVIGTRFDPATPYAATRPYTDAFPNGRMLTLDGWGHTIVGQSRCADRRVATYLVDGTPLRDGAVCRPDHQPFPGHTRTRLAPRPPRPPALPGLDS
ncbi:MAG: alpha/beta fold hydrolase [Streptosporangiales bacterium]|nr:alpha/beta fold hydrolase [Streptosporangiales bacterium]